MKRRLVVGLTGSFGSGKTTVGKILKKLGAKKVIGADQLAHEAFSPANGCLRKIKSLFKNEGPLNRKKIAQEIFSNTQKRKALEAIIHPYVRRRMMNELGKIKRGVVILEIPLLFEVEFDRLCDVTITVSAGRSNMMKRLIRSGFSRNEINARLKTQFSESKKMKKADFIIANKGSEKLLKQKTEWVWQKLMSQFDRNEN